MSPTPSRELFADRKYFHCTQTERNRIYANLTEPSSEQGRNVTQKEKMFASFEQMMNFIHELHTNSRNTNSHNTSCSKKWTKITKKGNDRENSARRELFSLFCSTISRLVN